MNRQVQCYLRPIEISDLDFLFAVENDTEFWYVSDTKEYFSREVLEDYIEHASKESLEEATQFRWVICDPNIGAVGFLDLFNYNRYNKSAEIGIIIYPKALHGMGYGTSAIKLLIHNLRESKNVKILEAMVYSNHLRSINLFLGLGFKELKIVNNGQKHFSLNIYE